MLQSDDQGIPFTRRHERCLFQYGADIKELKSDVRGLKTDVGGLKTDVGGLKAEVSRLGIMMEESEKRQMAMLEILDGIQQRFDRQDRHEQMLTDHDHRLAAIESKIRS